MSKSLVIAPEQGSTITFTNISTPEHVSLDDLALDTLQTIKDSSVTNTGLATINNAHIDEYKMNGKVFGVDHNAWVPDRIAAIRLYGSNSYVYLNPGDSVTIVVRSSAEALYYLDQKSTLLSVTTNFVTESGSDDSSGKSYGLYLDRTTGVGEEDSINFNSVEVTADMTGNLFTVTFDANGHGTAPASVKVVDGNKIDEPEDPTAEGFTFGGWFTESAATNEFDFVNTAITEDITLYAKWTKA